ncbi:MAG TPA: hypothetical protein VLJ38_13165 [Polyangiaceae bacterium]|nr:hypothetical protein [Polyangiaceae bacterium]
MDPPFARCGILRAMQRFLLRHVWLRLVMSAVPAASALSLQGCSQQAAAPAAAPAGQASATALPFEPSKLGSSIFVMHQISDLDAYEKYFESGDTHRETAGVDGYLLSRLADGRVIVHLFADDLNRVQSVLNSEAMQGRLHRPDAPDTSQVWVTRDASLSLPVTPPPGQTFSLYFKLEVPDFDAFKRGFEARDRLYAAHGAIGRGLHQSTTGRFVVVHFVGTSRDELAALTKDPDFVALLSLAAPDGAGQPFLAEDLAHSRPK